MRAAVDGLPTPVRLVDLLPGIYQDDHFTGRFTAGFDDVLAPVFGVLDSLEAYIDPYLCPPDFLPWLAQWVGVSLDEDWDEERHRRLVANAIFLHRFRGTIAGLRAEVMLFTGGDVQVTESGGTSWSQTPNGAFTGEEVPRLAVRVLVDDPTTVNLKGVEGIVDGAKPAHVVSSVEVVARGAGNR